MIRVQDLRFAYNKADSPAVDRLSFEIEPGEVFGFLGPSGAGKSTTQKILIGLLEDYQGSIQVMDRDLADWGADYYERVGVSFEFPNHYLKLTANENLRYFGALYRGTQRSPASLLESVGLEEDGDLLVSQYSKGMKTRLGVARALLHDPELLFLDEPTAGLDPINARRIVDLIQAHRRSGKTVFLTTHDMAVADELCDRVAFIVDGRIALIDTPRALKLRGGEPEVRVEYSLEPSTQPGTDSGADSANSGNGDTSSAARGSEEFPLAGLGDNARFLQLIRSQQVQTIHTLEATLADVFIQVTGRDLQ